jgi:uncharacterized protein YndB with AHSA1/START domain
MPVDIAPTALAALPDRIEKTILIQRPPSRVWRALTDHREFGAWFRLEIDHPFVVGEISRGRNVYPGYEHEPWASLIVAIEPERYFAYRWSPYAVDRSLDYADEPPTLVEFSLEAEGTATRLRVVESGFRSLFAHRRAEALRMNTIGWEEQLGNIARHVEADVETLHETAPG